MLSNSVLGRWRNHSTLEPFHSKYMHWSLSLIAYLAVPCVNSLEAPRTNSGQAPKTMEYYCIPFKASLLCTIDVPSFCCAKKACAPLGLNIEGALIELANSDILSNMISSKTSPNKMRNLNTYAAHLVVSQGPPGGRDPLGVCQRLQPLTVSRVLASHAVHFFKESLVLGEI